MSAIVIDAVVRLVGTCGIDDVEVLCNALETKQAEKVDLSKATSLHTGLWQALMVLRPGLIGTEVSPLSSGPLLSRLAPYINMENVP